MEMLLIRTDKIGRDGRFWPKKVVEEAVNSPLFQDRLLTGNFYGELLAAAGEEQLSERIEMEKVSHLVTSIYFKGNDLYGNVEILTQLTAGKACKKLLDNYPQIRPNLRGSGDIEMITQEHYEGYKRYSKKVDYVKDLTIISFDFIMRLKP